MIVAINDDGSVNLKVMLDGQGDHWAKSVKKGDTTGEWNFYPKHECAEVPAVEEAPILELHSVLDEVPEVEEVQTSEEVSALDEVPAADESKPAESVSPGQPEKEKTQSKKSNGKKAL